MKPALDVALAPVPASGTDVGTADALLVSATVPCRRPIDTGRKNTVKVFVRPGEMSNGGAGETASKLPTLGIFTPVIVSLAVAGFLVIILFFGNGGGIFGGTSIEV